MPVRDREGRPGSTAPFTSVGPIASPVGDDPASAMDPADLEFLDVGRSVSGWYNFGGIKSIRRFVSTRLSGTARPVFGDGGRDNRTSVGSGLTLR